MFLLSIFLKRLFRRGTLNVIDVKGRTHVFGEMPGPELTIRIHHRKIYWRLFFFPSMTAGEGYMDGDITVEDGDILDLLRLALVNMRREPGHLRWQLPGKSAINYLRQLNPASRSRRNVAHHYEFSRAFFDLFLDSARQYSCAYFRTPDDSLEQAQQNKLNHIAGKLLLRPEHRVLDIGCGWGDLALYLAGLEDVEVTGVTLSGEQADLAQARAREAGLDGRVRFELKDYREVEGRFDRIVSVGMFEAVGLPHYSTYFCKVRDLLADDGVALVHTIGRTDGAGSTTGWTAKYIFPGGYSPALSEMLPVLERSGLIVTDIEVLRLHYAYTALAWYRRFQERRNEIKAMYDERFCRMFEFYLAGCVGSFESGELVVFQLQLAKQQNAAPLTRDYLYHALKAPGRPKIAR